MEKGDAKALLIEFYLALERAQVGPVSVHRAIAAARAVGAKFRNAEAYMWLAPFARGERPELSPGESPGNPPATSPASSICVIPKPLPEAGNNAPGESSELSPGYPPRARAAIELVPKSNVLPSVGSLNQRRNGTLRAVGDAQTEADRERAKNDDFYARVAKRIPGPRQ